MFYLLEKESHIIVIKCQAEEENKTTCWGIGSVVKHLPSMYEAVGSIPRTDKKTQNAACLSDVGLKPR